MGLSRSTLSFAVIALALVVEGFDLQAANLAGPAIVSAFGITPAELGPVLSASLLGVLVGSLLIGPLGDRHGRRRVMILSCVAYGTISLLTVFAGTIWQLAIMRFLVGVGLGGMLPNALAMAGQIASTRFRATATGLVGIGITFGGVVGGIAAAKFVPSYGWQAMFILGGILPFLIAIPIRLLLPAGAPTEAMPTEDLREKPGVGQLLAEGMRAQTITIWVIFALCLMSGYLLNAWVPLVTREAHFSLEQSAWLTTAYHFGGTMGGILSSLLLRWNRWKATALFAMGAGIALSLNGLAVWPVATLTLLIVFAGFSVTGTQNAINGAAGTSYPEHLRSSGLGWALGMGRIGSIIGPLVGSAAAATGLFAPHQFFFLPVIPMVLAGLLALTLVRASAAPR